MLTFTGPTAGTVTPVHSANGLYSATFEPTIVGTYTVAVALSNSYTDAFPLISTYISESPKTITVVAPTWLTTPLTTNFYIYAAAAKTVTLPAQTESGFNTATYTHTVYVLPKTTFDSDPTCQTGGSGACYTSSYDVVTLPVFSADVTNPAAITFTIESMIIDRSYISDWMVVHMIKVGIKVIGFYSWSFQIKDCCDNSLIAWSIVRRDSSTSTIT